MESLPRKKLLKYHTTKPPYFRNSECGPAKEVLSYNLWRNITETELETLTNVLSDTPDELYHTFMGMRSKTKAESSKPPRTRGDAFESLRRQATIRKMQLEEHLRNISLNRQKPIIKAMFPVGFCIRDFEPPIKSQKSLHSRKGKFRKLASTRDLVS